jgi:hypothetical protein
MTRALPIILIILSIIFLGIFTSYYTGKSLGALVQCKTLKNCQMACDKGYMLYIDADGNQTHCWCRTSENAKLIESYMLITDE